MGSGGIPLPGGQLLHKNEFIEKAVRFYSGYLDTESADAYLPKVLADVLEGKLSAFGKRMGHLLFKLSVDQNLMGNIRMPPENTSPSPSRRSSKPSRT